MSTHQTHHVRSSLAGGVLGLVALTLVAAILGGALSAIRANHSVDRLAGQLRDARTQITGLQADNARLVEQNRQLLAQNRELLEFLRKHGLEVPKVIPQPSTGAPSTGPSTPGSVSSDHPKASPSPSRPPHPSPSSSPSSPAGPTPTGDTNPFPGLDPLCSTAPILCARP